tara:strand:- start:3224 stop:4039 length:816 start_codon:yes stop_codon:yes gene_type:complete
MSIIIEDSNYNLKINEINLKLYTDSNKSTSTLLIIINREKFLNAINIDILNELHNVLNFYKNDKFVRSVVITGNGSKAFIAGADIKNMAKYSPEEAYVYSRAGQSLVQLIENYNKPIIAAINGYALGGGCEIASACHLRYASNNAIFGQPEVKLGIIAGWGGTQNLPKIVGLSNALDLLISGRNIDVNEAYRIGLVSAIFNQEDLIDEVMKITYVINRNSPNAICNTLSAIHNKDLDDDFQKEAQLFKESFKNNDSRIGLEAFLNKEKPKF